MNDAVNVVLITFRSRQVEAVVVLNNFGEPLVLLQWLLVSSP